MSIERHVYKTLHRNITHARQFSFPGYNYTLRWVKNKITVEIIHLFNASKSTYVVGWNVSNFFIVWLCFWRTQSGTFSDMQISTSCNLKVKVKVGYLLERCLHELDSLPEALLQSWKWQLIGKSQWYRGASRGYPLPALTNNWIRGAAYRHTTAPVSHTRPSPRSS